MPNVAAAYPFVSVTIDTKALQPVAQRSPGVVAVVGLVVRNVRGGAGDGEEGVVVRKEIGLRKGELPVEDVEELTLDAPDIPLAEDPGAERPVDVLECRVVQVLQSRSQYDSR